MQGAIGRLCVVVAAAILNQPLFFSQENTTLLEQDEELIARMRAHEERLEMEQAKLEKELSQQEKSSSDDDYSGYIWSFFSFMVFLVIEMCKIELADIETQPFEDENAENGYITPRMMVLDKDILRNFCDKCSYTSAHEHSRAREFVEGFVDDLLESLRSICDRGADMEIGDFVGIGSIFESWTMCKPLMCDLIVLITAPDPHSFQYHLWCSPSSDIPPNMQGCGKIEVTMFGENTESCLCGSANLGEDMLCLLHNKNNAAKVSRSPDELLCFKNTHFLAKDQVMRWFQISVTKAWGRISHKYDFEVTFCKLDATGAFKIRFPSGKIIILNIIPGVQLADTDAYFVSHFPSDGDNYPSPYWHLSLAVYERNLLKHFAKRLPQKSCHLHCLQIITFLNRKQSELTGTSAIMSYHIKTALMHLLLSRKTTEWDVECLEQRLQDMLGFLQRSLYEKRLHHALVGNSKVPKEIRIPENIRKAEPINLFRPLVLQRELYTATVAHFWEMLRNASALIHEYTPHLLNGGIRHSMPECL